MNCPRCNARVAFMRDRCDNCGQSLVNHRRIVSLSNIYYNHGLEQAKVRDLSGAIASLKQSLQFYKLNTNARNLLGLIYFEVGEVVSALSEWVISKHLQSLDNDADKYIRMVQADPNKLEVYNQTLKKYNSALFSAQHGDGDMAIIQLKKVVSLNSHFIRAHQLLALLYMMTGRKDNRVRAKHLLVHISKIDATNTTTIKYLKELSDVHLRRENPAPRKVSDTPASAQENRKKLPRVETDAYKQITPYKEEKPSILPFVNVVVGVVIGMALMGFLIMPHINSAKSQKANSEFKKYSEQKAANDSDVSTLKKENENLQKELDKVKAENEELQGGTGEGGTTMQESYEYLVSAIQSYQQGDNEKAAKALAKVNADILESSESREAYDKVKKETYPKVSDDYFKEGRDAYNGQGQYAGARDYDKAVRLLEKALEYDEENTDAMFFLGRCYQQQNDPDKAKEYYNQIINDYPSSHRVSEAQRRLRELGE